MKYAIMGTGGTGGCIGAYLAQNGEEVTFIARGRHLEAIKENGLRVESSDKGNFTVMPNGTSIWACTAEEYDDKADVIFVCVKYYSIADAVAFVKKAAHKDTVVIPVLNVYGTGAAMQKELGDITVTDGCIYIYGFIKESGIIAKPSDIFKVYFGLRDGQNTVSYPVLEKIRDDMIRAGIEAYLSDNIKKDTFRKFTYISPVATAGLCCNATAGDFLHEGEARTTLISLMTELLALGKAMGIEYEEDMVEYNLRIIAGLKPDADTSMQRDVAAGRKAETDGLIHQVVRWGREYGIPMPAYEKAALKF